jgi:CRISPR-associated protein Cas5t
MLGLYVSVPVACWRKGHAREFLETEVIPPPATCYGFLLSLVGEVDRDRHHGVRVTCGAQQFGALSLVLRTVWRIKTRKEPPGTANNLRPDFQQLLSDSRLRIWLDSSDEINPGQTLEERVRSALEHPETVERFGGLSLGESTHLVDEVSLIKDSAESVDTFLLAEDGLVTLPVWVDHVGSAGTRRAVGSLKKTAIPERSLLPKIGPH